MRAARAPYRWARLRPELRPDGRLRAAIRQGQSLDLVRSFNCGDDGPRTSYGWVAGLEHGFPRNACANATHRQRRCKRHLCARVRSERIAEAAEVMALRLSL